MPYYARLTDNKMEVFIEEDGRLCHQSEALIGDQLLDFIYYDLRKLNKALDGAYSLATSVKDADFRVVFKDLDTQNIYLRFFAELFLDTLILDKPMTKAGFEALCNRFPNEVALLMEYAKVSYRTVGKAFLIGVFSVHAMGMQEFMKSQLEFCMNSTDEKLYHDLSPTERLYLYEQWRKVQGEQPLYFEADTFSSRLVISENIEMEGDFSIEKMAGLIDAKKPEIAEMTVLPNGWTLMRYELMKMVTQGVAVKICGNCGRYFIPDGRSDIEYCSRPLPDQPERTCQTVGALLKHQNKVKNDPIYMEYNKAYKRNNSRVRYGIMGQDEFLKWSDEARAMRERCLNGEIDMSTFTEWLNRDRIYKRMS